MGQDLEGAICRAYRRVSSEEQAKSGFSLLAQKDRLEQFARSQGWTIIQHYEDDGYSAKNMKRPALQRMLADSQPGEIILVYKLDRLTRSVQDLYWLLDRFQKTGALFKSSTEDFSTTTANGRLFLSLVGAMAQWERETISERSTLGLAQKAQKGEWGGGPVPFGFKAVEWIVDGRPVVRKGRTLIQLVRDPDLAHIVEEIFARYLAGQGVRSISVWMNDEKRVRAAKGGKWSDTSISRILQNPLFCGLIRQGQRSARPDAEVGPLREAINVEPIVSVDVWQQVQSMFEARKGMPPRLATGTWPLSGVARCGICGRALTKSPHAEKHRRYYRCLGYVRGLCGGKGPGKSLTSVPADSIERQVGELIASLQHPDNLDAIFSRFDAETQRQYGATNAERKRLLGEITRCEKAIRRWKEPYEAEEITWTEYKMEVGPHQAQLRTLQEALSQLQEMPAPPEREALATFAVDFQLAWEHLTPPERKSLLLQFTQAFGVQIVVRPGGYADLLPGCAPYDPSADPDSDLDLEPVLQ